MTVTEASTSPPTPEECDHPAPVVGVMLRDALTAIPGVGLKTASWAVRNHRASDSVAVLDVHIVRACEHLGVFPARSDVRA